MRNVFFIILLLCSVGETQEASCIRQDQSENYLRELLLSAASAGAFYTYITNKDKQKACFEVGRMTGRVSAASSYILGYFDRSVTNKVTQGLQKCQKKFELAKGICGDFAADLAKEEWDQLKNADLDKLKNEVSLATSCLRKEMYATLPQSAPKNSPTSQ